MNGSPDPEEVKAPETVEKPEPEPGPIVAYCRSCGQALTEETKHVYEGTIYCARHVPSAEPPRPAAPAAAAPPASNISPGLAFFLGIIPGVGAIYNEQYAKGVIHVLILGFLISIADHGGAGPVAGLLIALLFFYMPFEAYHTARRRMVGQPVDELSGLMPAGHRSGSMAGPIILIVLGALFLADSFHIFDFEQLLRFWPVALIALGVYRLMAVMRNREHREWHGARHE